MTEIKYKLLYTVAEVVELTGIGRDRIQQEIDGGRLKVFKLFGYSITKISHMALMEWIEANQHSANQNLPQTMYRS